MSKKKKNQTKAKRGREKTCDGKLKKSNILILPNRTNIYIYLEREREREREREKCHIYNNRMGIRRIKINGRRRDI